MLMLLMLPEAPAFAGVTSSFRYSLSNFSGPVRSQWARLAVDRERNEVYALDRHNNDIRVFDQHGMEIHVFGEDFTSTADIAIGEDGDIFVLTARYRESTIHLCNYRGQVVSEISIRNIPASFADFRADRLVYRKGSLYLADSNRMIAIVADATGSFKTGYDLKATLARLPSEEDEEGKRLQEIAINGFDADDQGNILFTIPSLFAAFRLSPDGNLEGFGRAGSGKGKFGVVAGIAADEKGYVYVSDRLRCVVLVFDRDLRFQTEFGYRGDRPSNLIVPDDVDIDSEGNVYVAQAANRGVSVFRVAFE
jgi:DNA-binding beta-propeller fold protein YncE